MFSRSDEYYSPFMPGANLSKLNEKKFAKIISKKVHVGKGVLIGAFSLLLPGTTLEDFSSTGAYSLVYKRIKSGHSFSNVITKKEILKKRDLKIMKMKYKKIFKILK